MNDFLAPSSEIYSDSLLVRMLRRVGAEGRQTDVVSEVRLGELTERWPVRQDWSSTANTPQLQTTH